MNSAGEATAHKTVGVRNIAEKSEATVLEGDFVIDVFEAHWIRSEGRQVLLLNTYLSATNANEGTPYQGEASIMAAFTVEPAIKLLDVLDIKTDRFSGFWEQHPTFRLTSQSEAFVIYSTHSNAGESYNDLAVMFIEGDRFKTITSVFLFNTQGCGATITETPDFRALKSPGRKYPGVLVRVKVTKEADGAECDQRSRGYTRYYQVTYYWNRTKAEYESGSGQLAALDKFNRKRL